MESSLEEVLAAGRAAWPTVRMDAEALARRLEAHEQQGSAVAREHAADFYLSCACALGVAEATRALDAILRNEVAPAVARINSRADFVDDALQALRVKLLTGDDPKIATYSGRSTLRRWLATAATRTALNLRRGKDNEAHEAVTSAIGARVTRGPELAYVRERYRDAFEEALRSALTELTDRERALLRMNLVEQLGVDRLARLYGCGRSTVFRWITAARGKLLDSIRAQLHAKLGATDSELESLAAVVRSDLDVSIARLLDPAG
jgi:RNA polymerase sigma-70 factor (ECF subfamily)